MGTHTRPTQAEQLRGPGMAGPPKHPRFLFFLFSFFFFSCSFLFFFPPPSGLSPRQLARNLRFVQLQRNHGCRNWRPLGSTGRGGLYRNQAPKNLSLAVAAEKKKPDIAWQARTRAVLNAQGKRRTSLCDAQESHHAEPAACEHHPETKPRSPHKPVVAHPLDARPMAGPL